MCIRDRLRRYALTKSDARTPAQQGDDLLNMVMHRRCHVVVCIKACLLLLVEEDVVNTLNDLLFEDAQPSTSYEQIPVFHFSVSVRGCRKPVMSMFCLQQIYPQIAAETSEGLYQGQVDTTCTLTTSFGELPGSKNDFLLVCCNQPVCCSQAASLLDVQLHA